MTLVFSKSAAKEFQALDRTLQVRLAAKMDALLIDPHPVGSKKLEGHEALYRIRVGDYRIVYSVQDEKLTVTVVRVAHRKHVYRT